MYFTEILCIAVLVAANGEFWRFGGFALDVYLSVHYSTLVEQELQLDQQMLKRVTGYSWVEDSTSLLSLAFTRVLFLQGHVAALVRSHAIGLLPFRLTKEQTTQTMDPSPKTIELLHYPGQWNLELTGSCYSTVSTGKTVLHFL